MKTLFVLLLGLAAIASCDPVHSNKVASLGGEAPGVRTGPEHRGGQPCLECHDGKLGDPNAFSVAGTIYENADSKTPAVGAVVMLTSSNGSPIFDKTTNSAGNFYMTAGEYTPSYPMEVSVSYRGTTVKMISAIGRAGSCGTCHSDPAGNASAGHIYIPDGGVAP